MGIRWSEPKVVKNNTLIVVGGKFPTNKISADNIWTLYNAKKDQIKQDGFSIAKNENEWTIAYFHNITEKSYNKTRNGKDLWLEDFDNKLKKWNGSLKNSSPKKVEESTDSFDVLDDKPLKSPKKLSGKNNKIDDDIFDNVGESNEEVEIATDYELDDEADLAELNRALGK